MVPQSCVTTPRHGYGKSFVLHKKVGGTKAQLKFRKSVIALLLSFDVRIKEDLQQTSNKAVFHHHKSSDLSRLSGQHYLAHIPSTTSKKNAARKCVVCKRQGQRKETRYMCETCPSKPVSVLIRTT